MCDDRLPLDVELMHADVEAEGTLCMSWSRGSIRNRAVYFSAAAMLVLFALGGCEHGHLSFDQSSGTFSLPIGAGSNLSP